MSTFPFATRANRSGAGPVGCFRRASHGDCRHSVHAYARTPGRPTNRRQQHPAGLSVEPSHGQCFRAHGPCRGGLRRRRSQPRFQASGAERRPDAQPAPRRRRGAGCRSRPRRRRRGLSRRASAGERAADGAPGCWSALPLARSMAVRVLRCAQHGSASSWRSCQLLILPGRSARTCSRMCSSAFFSAASWSLSRCSAKCA